MGRHLNSRFMQHSISLDNVRILEVEPKWFERGVREIQINNLTLNKDAGRYNLTALGNNTQKML